MDSEQNTEKTPKEETAGNVPEKAVEKVSEKKQLSLAKVELKVTIPAERIEEARQQALIKISKQARIKGFRKGKVPKNVILKQFGGEVDDEALKAIVPEFFEQAVKEHELPAISGSEKVDPIKLEEGKALTFRAEIEVKPEVELKSYKGLKLKGEKVEVKSDEIEKELKGLQERQAGYEPAGEGAKAEEGDYLKIDFKGMIDGKVFKGGHGRGYDLVLGQGRLFPEFEKNIKGMEKGASKDFEITMPDDVQDKELAKKKAAFHVDVKELRKRQLPELNDAFAKKLGNYDNLAALKEEMEKRIREFKEKERRRKLADQVFDALIEKHKVEAPESMIKREEERLFQMNARQWQTAAGQGGAPFDEKRLREECKRGAEKMIKSSLVLEKISEAEGVQVSDDDLEKHIDNMAATQGVKPEELRKYIETRGSREGMRAQLVEEKTIELVVKAANIKE